MPEIVCFIDFGSIIGSDEDALSKSDFFASLHKPTYGYLYLPNYVPMKAPEVIQKQLKKRFGVYPDSFNYNHSDAKFLIEPDALDFFNKALALEGDLIKIVLLTRNPRRLIEEQLKFFNFTEDQLSKLTINNTHRKEDVVTEYLKEHEGIEQVYILDNSTIHRKLMHTAAEHFHKNVNSYAPNNFSLEQHLAEASGTESSTSTMPTSKATFFSNNKPASTAKKANSLEFWSNLLMSFATFTSAILMAHHLLHTENTEVSKL